MLNKLCPGLVPQEKSLRERDLGHPNRLGDLLDTHALSCHLLDGEKFLCRAHRCARTVLVNTWYLTQMWLWCIDWCHESVLCVDVKCAKVCCFVSYFLYVEHFSSKGAQNKHEHFLFWASHLHTTIPGNKIFRVCVLLMTHVLFFWKWECSRCDVDVCGVHGVNSGVVEMRC